MSFYSAPIFSSLDDYPMVHCATLAELPDGTLIAAWFAGAFETAPNQVIMAAWWSPTTGRWTSPRTIVAVPHQAVGQPVFLSHLNGELWLFFVVLMGQDWRSSEPYVQRSQDGGLTWSKPEPVMSYRGLMFRSKPLWLDTRLIVPVYDENRWVSMMLISDDFGYTWRLTSPIVTPTGNIHPTLVHLQDGQLVVYLRPGHGGTLWRTESWDRGETWSPPSPTVIPNPNSGFDLIRLFSGYLALAYNPSTTMRTPLAIALADPYEHWLTQRVLETEQAEFSYPTLLQAHNGAIHVVYTHRRRHIHHAYFSEAWLRSGDPILLEQIHAQPT